MRIYFGGNRRGCNRRHSNKRHRYSLTIKEEISRVHEELMITQLRSEPNKIPKPNRNDMMRMLVESNDSIDVDIPARYKALWVTNKLDGSEDHLVSERIITLVGQKLMLFRENRMKEPSPTNLKDMLKLITPPKGVKRAKDKNDVVPPDEGDEL